MILHSYAKVNLYLAVLARRKDGFHNLTTLFERINLADTIILKRRTDNRITITCRNKAVPLDASNLCYKSARLLREKCHVKEGLGIEIIKRIPVGAGLGGGSSNAAAVLVGLNTLWELGLTKKKLASFAAMIGSDVPFFVHDTPFAKAEGRGEKIRALGALDRVRLWHILVVPGIHVSTPSIYKAWDMRKIRRKRRLTTAVPDVTITASALRRGDFPGSGLLFNNLEPVTIELYPEVGIIKEKLLSSGAQDAVMSGSGSAVFGIAGSRQEASRIKARLSDEGGSWRTFVVRTI